MTEEIIKIEERNIKQSNRLIESNYRLTVYEQRVILAICSQLSDDYQGGQKIRVKVNDLVDFCQVKKSPYHTLKRLIKQLRSRTVELERTDGPGWIITGWMSTAEYIEDEGIIEFTIDPQILPELINLRKAYLSTPAKELMNFRKNYTTRLYFLLKKRYDASPTYEHQEKEDEGKKFDIYKFEIKIDELRRKFKMGSSYALFANFKKAIEPAVEELDAKTDLALDYEYRKEGRAYKYMVFTVKKLKNNEKITVREEKQDIYDRLVLEPWNVNAKKAAWIVATYSRERIERNIRYASQNKTNKRSLGGWVGSCIEKDYAGQQAEAQDAAAKRVDEKHQAEIRAAAEAIRAENTELGQNLFTEEPDAANTGHIEKLHALYAKLGKA